MICENCSDLCPWYINSKKHDNCFKVMCLTIHRVYSVKEISQLLKLSTDEVIEIEKRALLKLKRTNIPL